MAFNCSDTRLSYSSSKAAAFSAETANEVYHHQVNLIKHDHACFCNCEHRRTEPEREDAK